MEDDKNTIDNIFSNLANVFRYLLPGLIILFLIRFFNQGGFIFDLLKSNDDSYNWYGITLVAIVIGAVITVVNRYTLMLIEDLAVIPLSERISQWWYIRNSTNFLKERFPSKKERSDHFFLRRSHCHFLLFLSEIAFIIRLNVNNNSFLGVGIVLLLTYLINSLLVESIEREVYKI